MPLYMCRRCGCVENTALGNYWSQQADYQEAHHGKVEGFEPMCSEHNPAIGAWHGEFPKKSAAGYFTDAADRFLYTPAEASGLQLKSRGPFRPAVLPAGAAA